MKILYLGSSTGTAKHRASALSRIGHEVLQLNPSAYVPRQRVLAKLHWETGGIFCERQVTAGVLRELGDQKFDVVWVDSGRYVGPSLVLKLKERSRAVLNYNVDNPYQRRDRYSWGLFRKAIPAYDLIVTLREENIGQAKALGARDSIRVYFSADEVAHAPRGITAQDFEKWGSEVAFIGTCFPERGPFMAQLVKAGVPLSIYGSDWQKSPEWPVLQPFWKGPDTHNEDDYAKKIQCSKICLGLLSKGNRDLHTTRSMEIPYLGGLLCAERTSEHQLLYDEGEEALFWDDPAECAQVCFESLKDENRLRQIAEQGRTRMLREGHLNEPTMAGILAHLGALELS